MGNSNSKKTSNNIISLYTNQKEYDYSNELNSAILLYNDEIEKNKNLDYKTKCLIVASFLRNIDKLIMIDKKKDYISNNYLHNYLNDVKIPIYIIDFIIKYKDINKHNCNDIIHVKKYDNIDNINNIDIKYDEKLNIIINLINNIYVI